MNKEIIKRYSKELNKEIVEFSCDGHIKKNIRELTAAVIINKKVREIMLDYCQLGDNEIKVFAEAIKENKNLTKLDLYNNHIYAVELISLRRHQREQEFNCTWLE